MDGDKAAASSSTSTTASGSSLRPSLLRQTLINEAIESFREEYRELNDHDYDSDEEASVVALFCEEHIPQIKECIDDTHEFKQSDLYRGRKAHIQLPLNYETLDHQNYMFAASGQISSKRMFPSDDNFYHVFDWSKHSFRRYDHFQRAFRYFPPDEMPWQFWQTRNKDVEYKITITAAAFRCTKFNTKHIYCKKHTEYLRAPLLVSVLCTDCFFRYIINKHDNNIIQKMESVHIAKDQSKPNLWKYTTEVPIADNFTLNKMNILCKTIDDYWTTVDALSNSLFCNYCLKATFGELVTGPSTRKYFKCIDKTQVV